jgi:hypothetical protein
MPGSLLKKIILISVLLLATRIDSDPDPGVYGLSFPFMSMEQRAYCHWFLFKNPYFVILCRWLLRNSTTWPAPSAGGPLEILV